MLASFLISQHYSSIMPDHEDSLGGETFSGEEQLDPAEQSLGDGATMGGDTAAHSLGDQSTFGDAYVDDELFDDGMELVDLSTRYTEEGVLGKGGFGEVILATDTRLGRKVAIKRIQGKAARSKTAVQRFLTEAKSIAALSHNNIVQVHDYGRSADGPFLIMECVQGGSLLDLCRKGPIELDEAVNIVSQLCDGLAKVHAAGIVHRDIKPANVLMTEDGIPKLTDFGLAKDDTADAGMTMEGAVIGTLDFMPPEQRQAAELTDHRSDLWSLAATFYQMITGKSPRVIRERDIPVSMRDLLMQALEEDPANRQSSALEFKKALLECRQTKTPEPLSGVVDEFSKNVPEGAHPTKGQSVEDKLEIPFATAVNGGEVSVNTVAGFTTPVMRVTIPAGIESGQQIRLKGKGHPGINGGPNGDILLTIKVAPPHATASLGIETEGGVMTPIVPKGTPLPTEEIQIYSTAADNQPAVTVKVYQGERKLAKHNRFISEFNLEGIPPAPRGVPQIEVTFSVDVNEQLSVSAKDLGTGESIHVDSFDDSPHATASLSLGIETEGGVMTPIVPKGTPLPTEEIQIYSTAADNQPAVTVKVYQGERKLAKHNRFISEFNLEGIPPAPRGVPQIEVTFSVDVNEQLSVSAKELGTGESMHVRIEDSAGVDDEEIDRMREDAEKHAEVDKKQFELVEARNKGEQLAYQLEKTMTVSGDKLSDEDKAPLTAAIEKVRHLSMGVDVNEITSAVDELEQTALAFSKTLYEAS